MANLDEQDTPQLQTFVVTTWETVQGTYEVKAVSEQAARELFGGRAMIDFDAGVQQLSYDAFDVEVRDVRAGD